MIPSLPSLDRAITDARVAPLDLKVLLALALELDIEQWRPVKELSLRHSLGLGRPRPSHAPRAPGARGGSRVPPPPSPVACAGPASARARRRAARALRALLPRGAHRDRHGRRPHRPAGLRREAVRAREWSG